ncbi:Uncharacterised protein [Mycobacteroides abscessus]|nr:hypothetical protein [Mycobacteroides abscessus]SHQ66726.1 Uncharacterised protein [Mycobacteroides abscessus subsp. abscessus]SIC94741.1 Uncharacterised protein [Mycobacteroides abscessus subsp. bolletii]SKK67046.1 Uncharacterised protein [Mycobacteroides abscessus subsp. massiliense]PVB46856.1 hypothetical protein DDK10_24190 [Mycobacteroides abscessus]
MAQPYKGPRKQVKRCLDRRVKAGIVARAKQLGMDTSPYIADLLAIHVGLPELARELRQEMLDGMPEIEAEEVLDGLVTPRFVHDVYDQIHHRAQARRISMAQYVEEVCRAHVDGRDLDDIAKQEVLLLTSA